MFQAVFLPLELSIFKLVNYQIASRDFRGYLMKTKSAKIFVIIFILGIGLFFCPKINTTTAYTEETHVIAYNEYIEFNAGIIDADEMLWFYYFQNNSDIELEVWMMDHAAYGNFVQTGSGTYYQLHSGSCNFSDYVSFGVADRIHILIFNIDVPQRTTEIRLLLGRSKITMFHYWF